MLLPRLYQARHGFNKPGRLRVGTGCCKPWPTAIRKRCGSVSHARKGDGASAVQAPPKSSLAVLSDAPAAHDRLPLSLYDVGQGPPLTHPELFDEAAWRKLSAELPVAGHEQLPRPAQSLNFLDTAEVEGLAELQGLAHDGAGIPSHFVMDDSLDFAATLKELQRHPLDSPDDVGAAGTPLITDLATLLSIPNPLARSLAAKIPRLLTAPASNTAARFQRYERALMMPLPAVVQLLCSSPNLANCTPEKLTYAVQGVSEELGVSGYQLQCLLLKNSWLLNLSQAMLTSKLAAVGEVFELNREQAIKVSLAQPVVLTVSHAGLLAKRECLLRLLGLPPKRLATLVAAEPAYLQKGSAYLATKMFRVSEVLCVTQPQLVVLLQKQPSLLFRSAASLGVKVQQLAATFQLPPERLLELVGRYPELLTRASDTVNAKCTNLAQQLGVPLEQVAGMLQRSPTLLSLSSDKINNRLVRLSKKLQLPPAKIAQLAVATPSLLTTRVHTLQKRWELLKALGTTHKNWAAQLMAYKAATIGPLLHLSAEKLLRLQYLAATQQQEQLAISSVVSYGAQRFGDKFPDFQGWLQEGEGRGLAAGAKRGRYKSKHKCGHSGRRSVRAKQK